MHTLGIARAIKKVNANKTGDFIYENYYKRIRFSKEESYCSLKRLKKNRLLSLANKLIKNLSDHRNSK